MKKLIAFDLDDTLAPSKSAMHSEMAEQLGKLLSHKKVCIISGAKFEQFQKQVVDNLPVPKELLLNLHMMPTCGTAYFKYNIKSDNWENIYSEGIPQEDKQKIIDALETATKKFSYWEDKTWGDIIEDRGSQITFSALGQSAPVDEKMKWDPDSKKRNQIREYAAELINDYEFRIGGSTSIDVTKPGIDKAYGMNRLIEELRIPKEDILFIGDKLQPEGNDYPVKAMGVDCVEIGNWQETKLVVETINLFFK